MPAPTHPPTAPVAVPSTDRRAWRFGLVAATSGLSYLVFSAAVRLGLLDGVDRSLGRLGRPDDVWGRRQQLLNHVPADFGPEMVGTALVTLLVLVLVVRRQWQLVLAAGLATAAAGGLAVATKYLVARPDGQGLVFNGGAYPSGHTMSAVICAGLALLLMWPAPRWWHLSLPLVPGIGMGISLVVVGMHWATDALGGGLLALTVLASVACWQATRFP